ncbi:hypothetical protein L484_001186 [Morus notabilis]|uniref:Uncharacterized protein n=1 Tax=Morus notabilis TaxID=981085 RepID=W9SMP8_9ROSA|nr:hypothetical protein L484_001186 [Morus notabilis]
MEVRTDSAMEQVGSFRVQTQREFAEIQTLPVLERKLEVILLKLDQLLAQQGIPAKDQQVGYGEGHTTQTVSRCGDSRLDPEGPRRQVTLEDMRSESRDSKAYDLAGEWTDATKLRVKEGSGRDLRGQHLKHRDAGLRDSYARGANLGAIEAGRGVATTLGMHSGANGADSDSAGAGAQKSGSMLAGSCDLGVGSLDF